MCKIAMPLALLTAGGIVASGATAASNPALPPAGNYSFGAHAGGFKVNSKRNQVTNLNLPFTVGPTGNCSSTKLPTGKLVATVSGPLKLTAAHRGGYTAYIVGRSTPKTSNGITAIPETFRLSHGARAKGTMYLVFNYDGPKAGSGQFDIGDCTLFVNFRKR